MEHILKPDDPCRDCQRRGLTNYLRYFYINLKDKILKCESNECLYPYDDNDDDDEYGDVQNQVADSKEHPIFTQIHCHVDDGTDFLGDLLKDTTQIKTEVTHLISDSTQLQTDTSTPLGLNSTNLESNHGHLESSHCDLETSQSTQLKSVDSTKDLPPTRRSENFTITEIQTDNWVQYAHVWNDTPAKEAGDKLVSVPAKDSNSAHSSSAATAVVAINASNDDVPKTRIKRFLDAINAHKNGPKTTMRKHVNTLKKVRTGRTLKHVVLTKDLPTRSRTKPSTLVRPLDLLQDIL